MDKQRLWLLVALLLIAALPNLAQAANYDVTQASDDGTGNTANSLSWAINQANGNAEDDTITLATDVTLSAALPDISSTITIEGDTHIIDGNSGDFSVLRVNSNGNLILKQTAVIGAKKTGDGGGVYNAGGGILLTDAIVSANTSSGFGGGMYNGIGGIVAMIDSAVTGNTGDFGGGIYNDGSIELVSTTVNTNTAGTDGSGMYNASTGTASLIKSTVTANTAAAGGGGIINSGSLTVKQSTINGNTSDGSGGGLANYPDGTVTLTNSTVSANTTSNYFGGGIINQGTVTLINVTVSGNAAPQGNGGGLHNVGTAVLQSSIISGNTAASAEVSEIFNSGGTVTANSYNVFGDSSETNAQAFADFTPGTNDVNATSDGTNTSLANILNARLANNGGTTKTHALVHGSPAIDLDSSCSTELTEDQRGHTRPVGNGCDAGSFEYKKVNMMPVYKLLLLK